MCGLLNGLLMIINTFIFRGSCQGRAGGRYRWATPFFLLPPIGDALPHFRRYCWEPRVRPNVNNSRWKVRSRSIPRIIHAFFHPNMTREAAPFYAILNEGPIDQMKEEIRGQLNDRQYEAVTAIDGPVLVIAGAGSGKTRVIEFRVRHLVEAASTLRQSSSLPSPGGRAGDDIEGREVATRGVRAWRAALSLLCQQDAAEVQRFFGLPHSFTIYDEADAEEAIHRCAVRLGFYAKEKRRPRKDMLRKILSMALNKEMSIEEVL